MADATLTLSQRSGLFDTATGNQQGWTQLCIIIKSILRLVQFNEPLLVNSRLNNIVRETRSTCSRTTIGATIKLQNNLSPAFNAALLALTQCATAEAIALLPINDPRRYPLTKINRALVGDNYKLVVQLGDTKVTLVDLARAPVARRDIQWAGQIIVGTTGWDTALKHVSGFSKEVRHVTIDMSDQPRRFEELLGDAVSVPFLEITGSGYRNPYLRVLRAKSIKGHRHADLPDELRLHFVPPISQE